MICMSTTMAMYHVIRAGGIGQGGLNFDAKVRRQSFTPEDMIHAHVGAVDLCARAYLLAAKLVQEGEYDAMIEQRYAGWESGEGLAMFEGKRTLEEIAAATEVAGVDPQPRSGGQERMENYLLAKDCLGCRAVWSRSWLAGVRLRSNCGSPRCERTVELCVLRSR